MVTKREREKEKKRKEEKVKAFMRRVKSEELFCVGAVWRAGLCRWPMGSGGVAAVRWRRPSR